METNSFVEAMQFNGWNYGHLYDWVHNCKGTYPANYEEDCVIDKCLVKRNDWIVKINDKEFVIMTNAEFQNKYC